MFTKEDKQKILKNPALATRPQDLCKKLYAKIKNYDDVTKMQYIDINTWMIGDILLKADRMSMANSLELRVPFLDREVFKVASTLPTNLKAPKENTKYALRQAAMKRLPMDTAQKEKLGFPVPTRVWLRDKKYYSIVKEAFLSETAQMFFNCEELIKILNDHYNGKWDNSRKVWTIYIFVVWYNIYFKELN
jgi:asparagine synthase (glutamine-hydrolysing)